MATLVERWRRPRTEQRYSLEEYANDLAGFYYQGLAYTGIQQTYQQDGGGERIEANFPGMVSGALKRNAVVFACVSVRLRIFTEARFQFQQMRAGRPGDLFGTSALEVLERPWTNGSTGELLARMEIDNSLAGNAYIRRTSPTASELALERLRPDWVTIVLGRNPDFVNPVVAGYMYEPGGPGSSSDPVFLAREEVAHWSPFPDPIATYRGMSWVTPVLREVSSDSAATSHKQMFFDHAATPNMAIKFDPSVTPEKVEKFKALMELEHRGAWNAWKTLFLGGGADPVTVGHSFKDMDYKAVQGAGETRIAAAAGVHPVIAALSEGLQGSSLNAGNFSAARRLVADTTMRPNWRSCAAALEAVVDVPTRARLWYDDRDIPFLQEDRKAAAEIEEIKARTIAALVRDGFDPKSAVAAVMAEDMSLLRHTGKLSVQLKDTDGDPSTPAVPNGGTNGDQPVEANA